MNETALDNGVHLYFYCHTRAKHDGMLLYEWLLEQARKQGIGGGSVFRAVAGYGRHGVLHQEQFFELADDLPVKVEFLLRQEQADVLLQLASSAGVDATCAMSPTKFALLGGN